MILRDISLILALASASVYCLIMQQSRFSKKFTYIATSIVIGIIFLWNAFFLLYFGTELAGRWLIVNYILPTLILLFFIDKYRDSRFLFTFCLADTYVLWVLLMTSVVDILIAPDGDRSVAFSLRLVIYIGSAVIGWLFSRKPYHTLQNDLPSGWTVFSIAAVIFYLTMAIVSSYPTFISERVSDYPKIFVIIYLLPLFYVTVFFFLVTQLRLSKTTEEKNNLDTWVRVVEARLNEDAEREKQIRILRHDMRHRLLLLDDYLKTGKYDKAEEYIATLTSELNATSRKRYCSNEAANAVLSFYCRMAEEQEITVEADMRIPEEIHIGDIDIAVVLSNAMENAIRASAQTKEKTIELKGFADGGKIFLEVKNPFVGTLTFDGPFPVSTKKDHGLGTRSIAEIVKKYGGVFSFMEENGDFVFRCAM